MMEQRKFYWTINQNIQKFLPCLFMKKIWGQLIDGYLWGMSGKNSSILFRVLNRISGYRFYKRYVNKLYRKKTLLALLNNIECEAHREIIIQGLKAKKN